MGRIVGQSSAEKKSRCWEREGPKRGVTRQRMIEYRRGHHCIDPAASLAVVGMEEDCARLLGQLMLNLYEDEIRKARYL